MPLRLSGSTGVSGIDGTAQAPAVQGSNPNAGIYYSGNNVIVSTSGNTALTVGPSGNVAISNSFSISGQYVSAYSGMMKNRIINGDMRIDQRFAGAANNNLGSGSSQHVVDRWYHTGTIAGKLRFQQNNTNGPGSAATQIATGFPNYFGANVVSSNTVNATDYWFFSQAIEGLNTSDLGWGTANASPVTLSFWSYSSIAGTHGGTITTGSGTQTAYPFTFNIAAANTWQYQAITVPGPTTGTWYTNNGIGINLFFNLGVGSSYQSTPGAWITSASQWPSGVVNIVSAANGAFYLTGVQLEKGSQATAFEFRHYGTELALCQRYYNKSYSISVVPGTVDTAGQNQSVGAGASVTTYFGFPCEMRATPTVTGYNPNSGTVGTFYGFGAGNSGTVSSAPGTRGFSISSTSATNGYWYTIHYTASAELGTQN